MHGQEVERCADAEGYFNLFLLSNENRKMIERPTSLFSEKGCGIQEFLVSPIGNGAFFVQKLEKYSSLMQRSKKILRKFEVLTKNRDTFHRRSPRRNRRFFVRSHGMDNHCRILDKISCIL